MSLDKQLTESEMVEEVEAILRTEQTGIGWMYRALKEGVPREKIMEEFQAQTSGFIYSYQNKTSFSFITLGNTYIADTTNNYIRIIT